VVKLISVVIALIVFGLFTFSFLSFGIYSATYNNPSQSIINDPEIGQYLTDINESLISVAGQSNTVEGAVGNSSITVGSQVNLLDSTRSIWKIILIVPKTVYALTAGLIIEKIGGNGISVILGVLGAILIFVFVFGVIRLIARGE
jgi:hypothetical protein